jgi:hypothetical protein
MEGINVSSEKKTGTVQARKAYLLIYMKSSGVAILVFFLPSSSAIFCFLHLREMEETQKQDTHRERAMDLIEEERKEKKRKEEEEGRKRCTYFMHKKTRDMHG